MNLPTNVNNFLVTVTDSQLRVMTRSAAGPASSPIMNAASGGAAVNRLSCTCTPRSLIIIIITDNEAYS